MKVSVNKLENVVGDMQLVEEKMTEFCTLNGKWRSTKERVYRIEIKMEMSDGTSYVSSVNTSKFTYKPAGPATGRFPIDDISELDQALRKLNITRDFDIVEHKWLLDRAAKAIVDEYSRQYYPGYSAGRRLKEIVAELNQFEG